MTQQSLPLVFYQSHLLATYAKRLIHGFTGKPLSLGGRSTAPEILRQNRQTLCQHLGLSLEKLVIPDQTHSANVKTNRDTDLSQTDAVILLDTGIPAMVMVADCTPIILYDPKQHIGAVVHAGWRGTQQAIAAETATTMIRTHGSDPKHMIAVIGPAISVCCYEVSPDVANTLAQTVHIAPSDFQKTNERGNPHVDLKTLNKAQLSSVGLTQIETITDCTYCQPENLFSYRRQDPGHQAAILQLL